MQSVAFEDTKIDLITRDSEVWARGSQIASALGYKDASAVSRIYGRNKDEFSGSMTSTVKLTDQNGQLKEMRVFSLRGAHLIAMFARTKKAKAFRRWVLDILDSLHAGGDYVRRQHEAANKALEDRKEQASEEGRGLASWRWQKQPLQMRVEYWRERQQLCLAIH